MKGYLRLLSFLRPYRKTILLAVLFMFLFAVFNGFSIGMISPFIKVLFAKGATALPGGLREPPVGSFLDVKSLSELKGLVVHHAEKYLLSSRPLVSLERVCFVILVIMFLKGVFGYLHTYLMSVVEQGVIRDLRNALFTHLQNLSLAFFHRKQIGHLISRVTNDVSLVRGAVTAALLNMVRDSLVLIVCLFWVFWVSWRLALVSLVVLPPSMFFIVWLSKRLQKASAATQETMADVTTVLQETMAGIRVVKAFGMEKFETDKFKKHTQEYFSRFVKLRRTGAMARPLSEYFGVIASSAVLWYGGREILEQGSLTSDRFFVFLVAMLSMMAPIKNLSSANNALQEGLAAAKRIFRLLDTEPDVKDREQARVISSFSDAIVFDHVSFEYESARGVLVDVNLEVKAGEILAIVGPSGAGKSTLVDLIPRFYDPTSGRILIDGIDLRDLKVNSLRRLMGIVTQETILFNDTVRNNIAYGLEGIPDSQVIASAEAANAHEFICSLPQGYDTVIGDRGTRLSGGERQRIALARAILKNPPILILDEATSALDSTSERLVQEAIERLMRGRTAFVVAHRLSTIQRADRIIVIENGRIVEEGTHEKLLRGSGAYEKLYRMQFGEAASRLYVLDGRKRV